MRFPAWQAVHDSAIYDNCADDLAPRLHTGQKLLARAQVQEAAVAAQLRTPPHRHRHGGTPVHVNLVPSCSPAAKDVSRLEQLSARLRESMYSTQKRLGGADGQVPSAATQLGSSSLPRSPAYQRAAPRQASSKQQSVAQVAVPSRRDLLDHWQSGSGTSSSTRALEEQIRGLELALQKEQQQSRRLHTQLSGVQSGADQEQRSSPWEQSRVDASPAAGARHKSDPIYTAAASDRRQQPRSGFALHGFQEKIRRLEEENQALRKALGLKQQTGVTEIGVEFSPG